MAKRRAKSAFIITLDGWVSIFQKLNEKIDAFANFGSFEEPLAVVGGVDELLCDSV